MVARCSVLAAPLSDVYGLSDRQLEDIGMIRTDRVFLLDREMAELRRKGIGPLV